MVIGPTQPAPVYGSPFVSANATATTPAAGPATFVSAQQRGTVARDATVQQALQGLAQQMDLLTMALKVQKADSFDARNKAFHEHFDKQPDDQRKLPYFATFMDMLPDKERTNVAKFLEGVGKQDAAKKAARK